MDSNMSDDTDGKGPDPFPPSVPAVSTSCSALNALSSCYDQDPILYLPITSEQTLLNCQNLNVSGSDNSVFVASYPKSGTTWYGSKMRQLVCVNSHLYCIELYCIGCRQSYIKY